MAKMDSKLLYLLILFAGCHQLSFSIRYGQPSKTLHSRPERDVNLPFTLTAREEASDSRIKHGEKIRKSRSLPSSASGKVHFNASVFTLNDSHTQLLVHWGGQGSNAIIILAKNNDFQKKTKSSVYISYDRGRSFQNKSSELKTPESPAIIEAFVNSVVYNSHYIFMDTVHKCIFTTTDYGRTFQYHEVPFSPDEISLHITNEKVILAMDKKDTEKKLWLSEDFGETWDVMQMHVKSFYWGVKGVDSENEIFVERLEPNGMSSLLKSPDFFKNEYKTQLLITGIEDFQVQGKFIFATKKERLLGTHSHNNTLQLWVSYNRNMFRLARFPDNKEFKIDYYIADASDDQVFLCVNHREMFTNLYVSDVTGIHYSLSLERIFYFNPEGPGKDTWIGFVTDSSFADFHKVAGLKGIYIASQLKKNYQLGGLGPEDLVTMITFDSGGEWKPLTPPSYDLQGHPLNCTLNGNCSLHLTQRFSQLYPVTRSLPIQSRSSAIGLIIASGILGKSLKGHPAIFLSTDAGVSWHKILDGNYLYAFGDHGGVIAAISAYNGEGPTNQLLYSTNEGETWETTTISDFKLRVYGLMTEPGERSTVFTLFGSRTEKHQWQIITIDLKAAFNRTCNADDYKLWSPSDQEHGGRECLLGKEEQFQRRIASAKCYNGEEFERVVSVKKCTCRQEDYECDEGYVMDLSTEKCVHDVAMKDELINIPSVCLPGTFYNRSKGYRKIVGDECEGGLNEEYEPDLVACPFPAEREFILFSQRKSINRIVLNREIQIEPLPILNLKNVIAVEYDFRNNCVYWADIDDDMVMRLCMDGVSRPEVLVETNLSSVEGLALDWLSNNLYFVDGEQATIEVIRTDVHHIGRLRRTLLAIPNIEKPRGIALAPHHGYMFFTEWGLNQSSISRAALDGSDLRNLITYPNVYWPNGVSIDYQENQLYWVDAKLNYIAYSDFDGHNVKKLISSSHTIPHPFAIGIFKEWMYWDDWKLEAIFIANKFTGAATDVVASRRQGLMDVKIFDRSLRENSNGICNPANNTCNYLCMALPGGRHVCRCPDGFNTKVENDTEICLCDGGIRMLPNGTCPMKNKCASNQFQCAGGKFCIPSIWKCDGDEDCDDHSDESDCESRTCNENEWTCRNRMCIPLQWRCDIDADCEDGSDEVGCHQSKCSSDEFTCTNGRCINKRWVCDLDNDCQDNSDEKNCTFNATQVCPVNEFKCLTTDQCLLQSWTCDGDKDCRDGSDEDNCTNHQCQPWQFRCNDGSCVFNSWKCDGDFDCLDRSDEVNCSSTTVTPSFLPTVTPTLAPYNCSPWTFKCRNNRCIPLWWRCDHVQDCTDGSDESDCLYSTTSTSSTTSAPHHICRENQFQCNNGDCVWEAWICDGERDCPEGEDEANCSVSCGSDHFRCAHSAGCISFKDVCNGIKDCADNSDEDGCSMLPVPGKGLACDSSLFECKSGLCISLDKRCNGEDNCLDGSDEVDCIAGAHEYVLSTLQVNEKTITTRGFIINWTPQHFNHTSFEYMPSIADVVLNNWTNLTWTAETNYKFTKLEPYTSYNVTVYMRSKGSSFISHSLKFITVRTFADVPSSPLNLTLQQDSKGHYLTWLPPLHPNGIVDGYRVYMVPPNPPKYEEIKSADETKFSLDDMEKQDILESFRPGTNHTFWVTAIAQDMESNSSNKVFLIDNHTLLSESIKDLEAKSIGNLTVTLDWKPVNETVDGYIISITSSVKLYRYEIIKTEKPPYTVTGLSPGSGYTFKVVAYKNMARSIPSEIQVRTTGEQLREPVIVNNNVFDNGSIYLSWEFPQDKRNADWEYGIQYGLSMNDVEKQGIKARSHLLHYMVNDLKHCEFYVFLVRVVGPYGVGPPSEAFGVKTAFNPLAKPVHVTVSTTSTGSSVVVSWKASCTIVTTPVAYKLCINDLVKNQESWSQTVQTNNTDVTLPLQVARGGRYSLKIQTAVTGSVPSEAIAFTGPPIVSPHQLKLTEANGDWELMWDVREVPTNLRYTFIVLVAENKDDLSNARTYEVSRNRLKLDMLTAGHTYYIAVKLKDEEGYTSELSEFVPCLKQIDDDAIILKSYTFVSIITPIVVIIIALVAAFTFLLVRHKRLKRVTLSFANSHYDTRSGATTFTTGDELDEEDSPMIRGFSDDEPLVIA